jgi:uncharacterized protein YukE
MTAAAYPDHEDALKPLHEVSGIETNHESTKQAVEQAGVEVQVVNWVYEQVTGQNLVESLITPISGDFTKISENAEAWKKVGESLRAVRANLNRGVSELRETWHGDAATAFEDLMVATWTTALEADAAAARLVGSAFEKVSEVSQQMCAKVLQIIKRIVDDLIEVAVTGWIPAAGWANAVRKVLGLIQWVDMALQILKAAEELYNQVVELAESVRAAGSKLRDIKDVHSLGDAVNYAFELKPVLSTAHANVKATEEGREGLESKINGKFEDKEKGSGLEYGFDKVAESFGSE